MNKDELINLQKKVSLLRAEGDYKETVKNCYKLLEIGNKLNDYKSILTAYINLAASYYSVGDFDMAFDLIIKHKDICDIKGDEADLLQSTNFLFLIYEHNKDMLKAKQMLDKCIDLGSKLEKYNILSSVYTNYSHIYLLEEDYEDALKMGIIALDIAKNYVPESIILEIKAKLNIAKSYIGLKDFELAKKLIDEIINNEELDLFIREKSYAYDLLGHWFSKQGLNIQAFEAFTKAKELAESYKDVKFLKLIQEERCKLCDIMGKIDLGYKVQKEYIELLGEINKMELDQTVLKHEIGLQLKEIEKKANLDFLTGAYNRRYLEEIVDKLIRKNDQKKEEIAFIFFDIDKFKLINDRYGHVFGDNVIKSVSEICKANLRHNDIFARYGGDEFGIILVGASLETAIDRANKILDYVRNIKLIINEEVVNITLSIGVTDLLSSKATDFDSLLHSADMKLYEAKKLGRNKVYY